MNWDDKHPTYRRELGRRLLSVSERFPSRKKAAEAAGITSEQLGKWIGKEGSEIPKVPVEALLALADAAGVDFYWLVTGEGEIEPSEKPQRKRPEPSVANDVLEVPRYDVKVSAGHGCFTDNAKVLGTIPFRPEFFTRNLQRSPENMIIVDAKGDSMAPTMEDRDLLMIDVSTAQEPLFAGIYAFTYDDALFVKRLQKIPGGILATSDNKEYKEFGISSADKDQFRIIGRVVWIGRML
ncbi:S24 family peptidase [Roseobacteraceae bacterium NS-SX3]